LTYPIEGILRLLFVRRVSDVQGRVWRLPVLAIFLVVALASVAACGGTQTLVLATTTSTADSGLLDDILPGFEEEEGVIVRVLAVGTGQALAIAEHGDADVFLVHDTSKEESFIAQGFNESRHNVMSNDFVIIGPVSDPAGIADVMSATEAFRRLASELPNSSAVFLSRGDESGTHAKERKLWVEAGVNPSPTWLRSTGQGMGATLTVADELQAYTLVDRGTFLAHEERLQLGIMVEGDPLLFNQYGVIAVSQERNSSINFELGSKLVEYLLRNDTQERIGEFGTAQYSRPLFQPNAN